MGFTSLSIKERNKRIVTVNSYYLREDLRRIFINKGEIDYEVLPKENKT